MIQTQSFSENGFAIIDEIYSEQEVCQILFEIENADSEKNNFRKSTDVFAIR